MIEKRRRWRNPFAAGACGVLMAAALLVSTACADAPAVTSVTTPTVAAAPISPAATVAASVASPATTAAPAPTSPSPAVVQAGATSAPTAPAPGTEVSVEELVQAIERGPHETIASADRSAELLIPQGALPPGVAAKDIAITKLAPADAPFTIDGEPPLVAYQLAPDGLQFVQPVAIRLRGLAAGAGLPGVFRIAGKRVTLLDRVWVESDPASGTARVTGVLSGFSKVAVSVRGIFQVSIANPGAQVVYKPLVASAVVQAARSQTIKIDGATVILRLVDPWVLKGVFVSLLQRLTPSTIDNAPPLTSVHGDAFTSRGTFTCVTTGAAELAYYVAFGWKFEFVYDDGASILHTSSQNLDVRTGRFDCIALPTPTPTTAVTTSNRPPVVEGMVATFVQADRSTWYEVKASDPDGDQLKYLWIYEGPPCGTFNPDGSTGPAARWHHPDNTCPTGQPHAGVITVVVSDPGGLEVRLEYPHGSADGDVTPVPKR